MNTYVQLYNYLQESNFKNINEWLSISWKGKDKQESIFRLFCYLDLFNELRNYKICKGNYNKGNLEILITKDNLFYDEYKKEISLKDSGDASDLTAMNDEEILVTTSKNVNNLNIGNLDIEKLKVISKKYNKKIKYCIVIRSKEEFKSMIKNVHSSSNYILEILQNDYILIDWNDINRAYLTFKKIYTKEMQLLKSPFILKFHQELSIKKTMDLLNNKSHILWGHIPRSGKSYIMAGTIFEHSKDRNGKNYLIITTAPNETISQYISIFNCTQLSDFNLIYYKNDKEEIILKEKNIIICSKQFLQKKNIKWMSNMNFDISFIDESHNGGTTDLSKDIFKRYCKNHIIFITATYSKPINEFDIPENNWILWNMEDVTLCKNGNIDKLYNKHGEYVKLLMSKYRIEDIISEYSKYPLLMILTNEINKETLNDIIQKKSIYGWSTEACFLLKQNDKYYIDEFQNESENLKLWYRIFGKDNIPDDKVFLKRIHTICKNASYNSRTTFYDNLESGNAAFYGGPLVILCFLPTDNIDLLSKATEKLLKKYNVIPSFEIVCINSKISNNPKKIIEDGLLIAKNMNKKGVLVLSGKQCSLGVTIEMCDVVILLNETKSSDSLFQMFYRCMTESKNKKIGFVIDPNIHRVINKSLIEYTFSLNTKVLPAPTPSASNNDTLSVLKYIFKEKIILLNVDHWSVEFGNHVSKIDEIIENIYKIHSSNLLECVKTISTLFRYNNVILNEEDDELFKSVLNIDKEKLKETKNEEAKEDDEEKISKGV